MIYISSIFMKNDI